MTLKVSYKWLDFSDLWRRGWDSNPRALSDNTLSRRARYDHFGTSPLWWTATVAGTFDYSKRAFVSSFSSTADVPASWP